MSDQVLLSINGHPDIVVNPYEYTNNGCYSGGWKSFQLVVDPTRLQVGANTFTWTIGPRPDCVDDWVWDGFSVKSLEIQFDIDDAITACGMPITVNVDVARNQDGLLLTWFGSPDNDHYEVHRSTEPYFTPGTTTFLDTVPQVGGTVRYQDIDMTGDPANNYYY